ncbi:MAG: glycosyltransferase [Solobacterium sp.]|nr:glycosyltransferase [Solobacterium sp.]
MKVLLYYENESLIQMSGIGRALEHQKAALASQSIEYTVHPTDDYDILHINTVGLNSELMIHHARKHGKKVIYHAHSTEEDFRNSFKLSNLVSPLWKKSLVSLYSKADAIITPTPYSRSLIQNYGIELPIYPISNGIDLSQYVYDEEKVLAFHRYFHLSENQNVVIGVGLPFERKGILDFVEVAKRMPEVTFIWFGELNPIAVPAKVNEVVENYPSNCIFPGYVKGPIIQGAYCAANAFFFPSYEETEGIVVLEALAAKQQVIVRDIGVFESWLKNGVSCYKGCSNGEFRNLLEGCLKGNLPHTGKQGYEVAKTRTIEVVGQQLRMVYEAVLREELLDDMALGKVEQSVK